MSAPAPQDGRVDVAALRAIRAGDWLDSEDVKCAGKGAPVQGCDCPWCRVLRPPQAPHADLPPRLDAPHGDFLEDERDRYMLGVA